MRVLVTGGQGFIGRYVVEELIRCDHTPVVFDRYERNLDGTEFYLGDVTDPVAVTEAMAHVQAWIHLAGVLGTAETIFNPRPAAVTNIIGGLNVLEAASQYNLPGVNIAVGNYWMDNTYSITKNTVERFCHMFRDERGLRVNVVRALNAYGPRQSLPEPWGPSKVRKIMPSFIARALTGKPIEVYGDGEQVMDMIYVEDVAKVLVSSLFCAMAGEVFPRVVDAGTGRITTVQQIAQCVVDTVGQGEIVHLPMRPGEPPMSVVLADTDPMTELTGIEPEYFVPLEEGVGRTVSYFRSVLKES